MQAMPASARAGDPKERKRAARLSLVAGTAIFAGKFGAYALTGSTAVLSDALESIVNVAAAALLLYSVVVAARPADRDHPYGHGKVEFFSAGVEGTLIAVAAGLILFEAGREILQGPELRRLNLGLALVAGLAAVNAALGLYLIRVGRRTSSLALVADGRHLLTDVWTSAAVVAGLGAVRLTGFVLLDPLVAIAVALNILRTGFSLAREAVGGLMDEADRDLLARVAGGLEARREPWWIDVHSLRAWRSGEVQHVDLHLAVPRYFDADRLHAINHEVERVVLDAAGGPGEVIIHFDPCRPRQCPGCAVDACPVRESPFEKREPLTLERVTRGDEVLETGQPVGSLRMRRPAAGEARAGRERPVAPHCAFGETVDAYVGLGSNLGDRRGHIERAVRSLRRTPGVDEVALSPLYETEPVGGPPQPKYLNAVARVRTGLEPHALLRRLHEIERVHGRERESGANAPRPLDLDLLLYGDRCIRTPELEVPHPRLHERAFVLEPLRDLAAEARHPELGRRIGELADRVRDPEAVRRIDA